MADTPKSTSLTAFENLVFGGKHSVALSMLLRMLDSIERGGELPQSGIGEGRDQAYFTRFAAAITTLLAMDPAPLTPQIADRLALHNRHITALFRLSGFADPGHLYRMVQAAHGARSDEAAVARNLAAVTVDAAVPINWQDLLPKLPSAASSAYLAQFAHRAPLSAAAERQRNALLDFAPLLEGYALRDTQLPLLCQA